jgi:hypothetical protein
MVKRQVCEWCDEEILLGEAWMPIGTPTGTGYQHRECALRTVVGGIGHLVAHHFWCTQQGDPDAGLTRRQSARLVLAYVEAVGVENLGSAADDDPRDSAASN